MGFIRKKLAIGTIGSGLLVGFVVGCTSGGDALIAPPNSAPAPALQPPTASPPRVSSAPTTVTVTLAVHSVKGDFGGYIVNPHDGNVATQTTFNVNSKGQWSKTITVPADSMVKLDI